MGILDGIVEWIAEQIMYGLDMINTSVLGALGCDMNTFLRYFPAAETMYSLLVALAIGLILLGWVWNLFKNYGLGLGVDAEDPVKLTAKAGSARLVSGASTLYDGVLQLQNGTDQLSGGLVQFNEEGISQLTGALDADQLHALQTVVEEMTSRLAGYTSFAGAPEGAEQRVKFIYKTAETPAETAPVETAADNATEGNFFVRLWHRLLALFGL